MGTIEWPDGTRTKLERKDGTMTQENPIADAQLASAATGRVKQEPTRTIATVAAELEAALSASKRIPELREELDGLLGRKRRAKKGGEK